MPGAWRIGWENLSKSQEVVNKDGQRYPGRTLYSLITGIKRFLAEKNVLLNPLDKLDDR